MKKFLNIIAALAMPLMALAQGWPAGYGGVMLQGFYWDSYNDTKWSKLEAQATELARNFDLVWIPQSAYCGGLSMGYDDLYWFTNYNSSFGTEAQLRSMIKTFKAKGIGTIADVVINHRKTINDWVTFPTEVYNGKTYRLLSTDICRNDDNGSTLAWARDNGKQLSDNNDTGEGWDGMRDLDHMSTNVQNNVLAYLDMLLNDLGYIGFRYDMVKGYHARYTGMYNAAVKPKFSVGECWDGSSTIAAWIANTAQGEGTNNEIQSAAFDFQFRYTVRNAANNGDWSRLVQNNDNSDGNWPLVSNMPDGKQIPYLKDNAYRRYAVTFVENHDTERRSNAEQDPLKVDTLAANAYMLSMPGTPCVFLKHWQAYKADIASMIAVRKAVGITNTSTYGMSRAEKAYYLGWTVGTNGRMVVMVGNTSATTPNRNNWTEVLSGYHYKYFLDRTMETAWVDRASGEYKDAFKARLTAVTKTDDVQLVYTTDGTTPTATHGTKVASGTTIDVDHDITINVGMLIGGTVKGIVSREYTFDGGSSRPPFEPYTINIHVKDPGWDNLNFWCWVEGSDNLCTENKAWPGDAIVQNRILQPAGKTKVVKGDTFYYKEYTVKDYDYDIMFIFSGGNGTPQTVNLGPFSKDVYLELGEIQADGKYAAVDVTKTYGTDAVTDVSTLPGKVVETKYVDPAGRVSDKPFHGVNIVINSHSDGSQSTTKVINTQQ